MLLIASLSALKLLMKYNDSLFSGGNIEMCCAIYYYSIITIAMYYSFIHEWHLKNYCKEIKFAVNKKYLFLINLSITLS